MVCVFFFFKQKTAYEMRISDLSSDVGSSDLELALHRHEDLDHLHDAGRQLVAALQLLDLVLEPVLEPLDALVEMAADPLEFGHRLIVRHHDLAPQAGRELAEHRGGPHRSRLGPPRAPADLLVDEPSTEPRVERHVLV